MHSVAFDRAGSPRTGFVGLLVMLLALVVWTASSTPTLAQDDGDAAAAPAADDGGGNTATTAANNEKSYLAWAYESLGLGYSLIFLALSFTLVALFVMNLLQARRETIMPTELLEGFEAHLNAKQFQEAYELASSDESFLGKVLSAGLGKVSKGYDQAIEAMQEVGEDESMKLEHRLSYMALIGTISPMVGLFGTVHGMIDSFQTIANSTGIQPTPAELAEGISTALFTTLIGLAVAIPAIAAYNILRNRIDRLVLEVGIISEGLMSRFQNAGKKQAAPQA
ncbi:MotA/TolQ/ExbB proton channel family protein [Aeoliella sp.]|uniref:MotA/TolQ/ExbB proton channel family protein n=1 Tax=Aeoliella sp. TaxID=2795800 RepID=UPI003CCBD1EC